MLATREAANFCGKTNEIVLYEERVSKWLHELHPDLEARLDQIQTFDPAIQEAVVSGFLELACLCQNTANVLLGRRGLARLPKAWLLQRIEDAAQPLLASGGSWAYWRLLEVYRELDADLVRRLASRAVASADAEIVDVGMDFLQLLDKRAGCGRSARVQTPDDPFVLILYGERGKELQAAFDRWLDAHQITQDALGHEHIRFNHYSVGPTGSSASGGQACAWGVSIRRSVLERFGVRVQGPQYF